LERRSRIINCAQRGIICTTLHSYNRDKCSSLLQYGINYSRKNVLSWSGLYYKHIPIIMTILKVMTQFGTSLFNHQLCSKRHHLHSFTLLQQCSSLLQYGINYSRKNVLLWSGLYYKHITIIMTILKVMLQFGASL
jgi:hypothetical protein